MVDTRRFSTGDVLALGILNTPAPKTDVPKERERASGSGEYGYFIGNEAVIAALDAGKLVDVSNYYGCFCAWRAEPGVYRGTLLQYRSVTEDPTFATVEELAEWVKDTYYSTDG